MAPLDLDKYVEIARQCKYLPENDLKVSRVGAVQLARQAPSGCGAPAGPPFSLGGIPTGRPILPRRRALRSVRGPGPRRRDAENQGSPNPPNAVQFCEGRSRGCHDLPAPTGPRANSLGLPETESGRADSAPGMGSSQQRCRELLSAPGTGPLCVQVPERWEAGGRDRCDHNGRE